MPMDPQTVLALMQRKRQRPTPGAGLAQMPNAIQSAAQQLYQMQMQQQRMDMMGAQQEAANAYRDQQLALGKQRLEEQKMRNQSIREAARARAQEKADKEMRERTGSVIAGIAGQGSVSPMLERGIQLEMPSGPREVPQAPKGLLGGAKLDMSTMDSIAQQLEQNPQQYLMTESERAIKAVRDMGVTPEQMSDAEIVGKTEQLAREIMAERSKARKLDADTRAAEAGASMKEQEANLYPEKLRVSMERAAQDLANARALGQKYNADLARIEKEALQSGKSDSELRIEFMEYLKAGPMAKAKQLNRQADMIERDAIIAGKIRNKDVRDRIEALRAQASAQMEQAKNAIGKRFGVSMPGESAVGSGEINFDEIDGNQ